MFCNPWGKFEGENVFGVQSKSFIQNIRVFVKVLHAQEHLQEIGEPANLDGCTLDYLHKIELK